MSRFSICNPHLITIACLVTAVVGISSLVRMPIDLFPTINIPEVVVATFYNGMPPEEIETEITGRFERFFTLGSGIDHMESRSLPGVSIIKVYFQPDTNADSDVTMVSNLAMANLRRLPPGTLPPVVLKFDASSLPVCLITLAGAGLSETAVRDLGQFTVRNQLAGVFGEASALLDEHLAEEEAEILPLVAEHLTPAEWQAIGDRGMASLPKNGTAFVFLGLILRETTDAERTAFLGLAPPPIRGFWHLFGKGIYRRAYHRLYDPVPGPRKTGSA